MQTGDSAVPQLCRLSLFKFLPMNKIQMGFHAHRASSYWKQKWTSITRNYHQREYPLSSRLIIRGNTLCAAIIADDRCANPRNLFWAFHAPHPSKNAQIEYIYKNIIKKYIFQNFTINYIFQKIKIFISKNLF